MNEVLKGKFNQKIVNFNNDFSIDMILSLNIEDAVDHFFGCCEYPFEGSIRNEDTLIYRLRKDFKLFEFEEINVDTTLGITYNDNFSTYRSIDKTLKKHGEQVEVSYPEVKRRAATILRVLRDSKEISEVLISSRNEFKIPVNVKDKLNFKIKNNEKIMTYGLRKLLSVYFPKIFIPLKTKEEIYTYIDEYEISNSTDEFKKLIDINRYCNLNQVNTFDCAYEFLNYARHRKMIIRMDKLVETEEELENQIRENLLLVQFKETKHGRTFDKYIETNPIRFSEGREIYISYKDRVLYKSIISKAKSETDKSIVLRLVNLKRINESYKSKTTQFVEFVQENFINDYEELFGRNSQLREIFDIMKYRKILKKFTVIRGKTKCHLENHHQHEEQLYILVIRDDDQVDVALTTCHYCEICDRYTVSFDEFNRLVEKYDIKNIVAEINNETKLDFDLKSQHSYLYALGYNVSQKNDVPRTQRRRIIDFVLEYEWSREKLVNHIQQEINKRKKLSNMRRAISLWEDDLRYIKTKNDKVIQATHFYVHYSGR